MRPRPRIVVATVAALAATTSIGPSAAEVWPTKVAASYKIIFAGFELGTFQFQSQVNGQSYSLAGDAKLTWGFGMFSWTGISRASGSVASAPRPAAYTLDVNTNAKTSSVKIGFNEAGVAAVNLQPPSPPGPGTVPLKDGHLRAVLDPLSAVMSVSRGAANPCGRRVPVFDGKQRFDLVFTFRRQERIVEQKPSGQPVVGYVCRVQYIPLAGYKTNRETQQMSANANIEVMLRPVPDANLLIPHTITIPTSVGTAILSVQRVDIVAPGNKQIALTQ